MAVYPDIDVTSSIKAIRENDLTTSESGVIRGQDLNASSLYEITLSHVTISVGNVGTLQTFFDTNRNTIITTRTLRDGNTYDCKLVKEPEIKDRNPTHKDVVQRLTGTRN